MEGQNAPSIASTPSWRSWAWMPDAGFGMLLFGRETYRHLSADLHLKALKSSSESSSDNCHKLSHMRCHVSLGHKAAMTRQSLDLLRRRYVVENRPLEASVERILRADTR